MSEHLLETVKDGVATLTMNRPESLNALSADMISKLLEAVPRLSMSAEVGAIILTGAGRSFCAGGDVKGMAAGNARSSSSANPSSIESSIESRANGLRINMEVSRLLHECSVPTIAMIRGPVAGAGLSMALACDIRIASDSLLMTTAFAKIGFSGDFGGSYFLTKMIGTAKARELYYTAAKIRADEALSLGMINRLVAEAELETQTGALAKQIADGARVATELMKKNLNAAESGNLSQLLDMEAYNMARTMFTEDHKEAARAFVEKRAPVFVGR